MDQSDAHGQWRRRLSRLPGQLRGENPFGGDSRPGRVPLLAFGRPGLPFPHPWNFRRPIEILDAYFWGAEEQAGPQRHNRYLDAPGCSPVLVTRDPGVIRAILTATGDREGQFDRDTLPTTGIARATGEDTLLFGNGALWRTQRRASAAPFGKTALFQEAIFSGFEDTFRHTVRERLRALRTHLQQTGEHRLTIAVEPEIKALMLEMLARCFFGAEVDPQELRDRHVPALERMIDHIVRDTVVNRIGLPHAALQRVSRRYAQAATDRSAFDELTDQVLAARHTGAGLWSKLKTDAPDDALRSNIKVFLAGALEATTSYATWAISHLARNDVWQQRVYDEVAGMADYTPERLASGESLQAVLDETLRLTPSLYFLPRRATTDTRVETADRRVLEIPAGTHILLDVWHANRHEDHWGEAVSGSPATAFAPQRWGVLAERQANSKDRLHFGFGHGPRVCPGKHLGQLEVALVVGVFVKLFRFRAVEPDAGVLAGVSTKPADRALVELELREPSAGMMSEQEWSRESASP